MTDVISPKLLVVLALSIAVAGFGAWRLLTVEDSAADVGFGPDTVGSIVITPNSDATAPVADYDDANGGRNPFARSDGGDTFTAIPLDPDESADTDGTAVQGSAEDPGSITPEPLLDAAASPPVFPDPGLLDQGPPIGDPRDDTSFNG